MPLINDMIAERRTGSLPPRPRLIEKIGGRGNSGFVGQNQTQSHGRLARESVTRGETLGGSELIYSFVL